MKIVIMHYHLKTGGVTTVIRRQIKVLKAAGCQVLVLSGELPPDDFPAQVHFIPGLGYTHLLEDEHSAKSVVQSILKVILRIWPNGPDLVHVHNPTLAKNRLLQHILKSLQAAGLKLLCQIHDFAEDGRPDAYFSEAYVDNCHYAVLNPRDFDLLVKAGLTKRGCHILPNSVSLDPTQVKTENNAEAAVLYPIRAIRRKNIGESILLSLFHHPPVCLAITQPPNSPLDIERYLQWQNFVERHGLPVVFEAGVKSDFNTLMGNSRYVLTTSITEGFGFAFLEAWLAGKALWGRLLPDICRGFIDAGVVLDHLYERLWVPLAWLDADALAHRWKATLCRMRVRFKQPCDQNIIDRAWQSVTENQQIDFGLLDEHFQQVIIEKLIQDPTASKALVRRNPFLNHPGPPDACQLLIENNFNEVVRHYSLENYAGRLRHLYTHVINNDVAQSINKSTLFEAFLNPLHFSLLKWGDRN